jgi:hypothetical protein
MIQEVSLERGQAIGEELMQVQREIDLRQLKFARLASEFELSDYYQEDGFTTPINWIRFNCHLNQGAAADRVAVGDCIEKLPQSLEAMEAGEIGFAHVVVMARTAEALPDGFKEAELINDAKKLTPGRLYHVCEHYKHAKDPAGFAQEQAEVVEKRKLELSAWPNGVLSLKGYLDPIGGAALRSALEPLARISGADDHRERKQRLADALVELACGGRKASLQVTTSLETLLGLAGAPAAETEFSLPISSKTVQRLACDCSITRILLDSESVVIDVGRSKRTISAPAMRALKARDGGCRWPGCDRPPKWTEGHHLAYWTRDLGDSNLPNQILLCHRHHWMVHEGKWQIVKQQDGTILTIPPTTRFRPWVRGPD